MFSDALIEHVTNQHSVSVKLHSVVGPPAEWPRSAANIQDKIRKWPRRASRLREYGLIWTKTVSMPSKQAAANIPFQSELPSVWASSRKRCLPP